jgi:hypothetical protein
MHNLLSRHIIKKAVPEIMLLGIHPFAIIFGWPILCSTMRPGTTMMPITTHITPTKYCLKKINDQTLHISIFLKNK